MPRAALLWFRRDLRLHDHPALRAAVAAADQVVPVFVLDPGLLGGRWPAPNRVRFMLASLAALRDDLGVRGAPLVLLAGRPAEVLPRLAAAVGARDVFATQDEPWTMPPSVQAAAGCVVGRDFPAPIVDHAMARARAIAAYRSIRDRDPAHSPGYSRPDGVSR